MERFLVILPNLDQGGTERVVMNYFRESGLAFDFVVHGEPGYFEPEARERGARIFRVPTRGQGFFKNIAAMRNLYKRHREYKTVIVCTEHSFAFIELLVAWLCGVKTRAAWSHFSDYQGKSKIKRRMHFLTRPLMGLFGNLFLACTKDAGRWLFGKTVLRNKRFYIIKNAVDMDRFNYNPQIRKEYRGKLNLNNRFAIGIIGRLTPVKNHTFVLHTFLRFSERDDNAVLLIIGDGELRGFLEKQAERLNIANKVIFTGRVDDTHHYYQALDVLLLPSFHEGFPMVAVEAQAAGLPVILSDTLSQEVAFTPLAQYKSLSAGTDAWTDAILKLKNKKRSAVDLAGSGFLITEATEHFKNILVRD
jgi:glycosyltransferase involved in cell wall biosynthesis